MLLRELVEKKRVCFHKGFDTWEEANHVLSQINAHKFHEDISIVEIGEIKDSI